MTGIFISYRQEDAKPWALLLAADLVEAFGDDRVFLDKDTLRAGSWREQIAHALDRAQVVLVVMGRKWVSIADTTGRRRLDDPTDVHRQEVATALSRKDVTVIPIRVDDAPLPRREELPVDLRDLVEQQAMELSDNSARRAVELAQLIADIEKATGFRAKQPVEEKPSQDRWSAQPPWQSVGWVFGTVVLSVFVLVVADIGLGWTLDPAEKSVVVLLVLLAVLVIKRWSRRSRGVRS